MCPFYYLKMARVNKPFRFKQFEIRQEQSSMKVGTDAVLLGAWTAVDGHDKALDIGTGTGIISMMLAQRNENLKVRAIDIHQASVREALYNFSRSPFRDRLEALECSAQEFSCIGQKSYDLIVSNPPFFLEGTRSELTQRDRARHTSSLSFEDLIGTVDQLLTRNGCFALILPVQEGQYFRKLAEAKGLYCVRYCEVRARAEKPIERLMMEFVREDKPIKKESLVINKDTGRNNWTDDYQALTRAFHIIL